MRQEGILIKWNDERGFGFIRPLSNAEEVFVHVSSFDRNGARPQLNDKLSFEIEAGSNGKKKAIRVTVERSASGRVPESRVAPPRVAAPRPVRRGGWSLWLVVPLIVLFGVLGYRQVMRQGMNQPQPFAVQSSPVPSSVGLPPPLQAVAPALPATVYRCDGRQHCSQMTSCEEATYFLRYCPDVKMDGDGDGIACEDQLCGH